MCDHKRSDGLIQNQRIEEKKSVLFTVRSLNENKMIKQFSIEMEEDALSVPETAGNAVDGKEADPEPMFDFMEYHYGYLYVKKQNGDSIRVYDVCSLSLSHSVTDRVHGVMP